MKTLALILFLTTYLLLIFFPKKRAFIALFFALIFVGLGIIPFKDTFFAIDWNVILMILGTMGIVTLFIESGMPTYLGDLIIDKMPDVRWATVSLALFAGGISAFVDNVSTLLIVAPIALSMAKRLKISPVPIIICIAISANLQGAATLVGDATSIMLGGYAGMNFLDFFFFKGRLGIFFAVEAGALVSALVLLYLFRKETKPIHLKEKAKIKDFFPTFLIVSMILFLILASFINNKPIVTNGLICTGLLVIGVIRDLINSKEREMLKKVLKELDYFTLLLLLGLFVVIGGIVKVGIVDDIGNFFVKLSGDNLFIIYSIIVWASVLLSAFIDNIPYVATMLPVVSSIAVILGVEPYLLYFGLLSGATLGGNLTPIGASTNIAALGILRKEKYHVSTLEFMKYGIPFTLSAVITGYIIIWFIWH